MRPVVAVALVIRELLPVEIPAHTELRVLVAPPVPEVSEAHVIGTVTRPAALVVHRDLAAAAGPPMEAWAVTEPLVSPS